MRSFFIAAMLGAAATVTAQENPIVINQEGYYVRGTKKAVLAGKIAADKFYVINNQNNDTVFIGRPGIPVPSRNSSLVCRMLEFPGVTQPGTYYIHVPGVGNSYTFPVNYEPLKNTAISSLKGFYYQRVSQPLDKKYAGLWARPAGHPDDSVLVHPSAASAGRPAGTVIKSPGGWYDAGDYNKYIVNSGITMGTLFSAYEDFPAYFDTLRTNIPETGNGLPDIIDEILVNLRWMLTMQDPNDGGVYHKMTNASFDGMVMPGVTKLPRYVVQKSTAATLDFAAVTAQAARILRKFNKQLPGLADSCKRAATSAYKWAIMNGDIIYDQDAMNKQFKPEITTGAYGDGRLWDEWIWSSSELYILTGDQLYASQLRSRAEKWPGLQSWNNVAMMGAFSLVRRAADLPKGFAEMPKIKDFIIRFADSLLNNATTNAFGTVMGGSPRDFEWGSSSVAANQGIICINAYLITKDTKYLEGALTNADYILGRNATGYCFVTGAGTKSTMKPHHRPSVADGIVPPVPGLLSGGPNPGKQDKCEGYKFSEPETAYLDDDCSYASNEIAINWNAPLVYLLNGLNALYRRQ